MDVAYFSSDKPWFNRVWPITYLLKKIAKHKSVQFKYRAHNERSPLRAYDLFIGQAYKGKGGSISRCGWASQEISTATRREPLLVIDSTSAIFQMNFYVLV